MTTRTRKAADAAGVEQTAGTTEATMQGADAATRKVEEALTYTKGQVEKATRQAFRVYDDAAGFQKDNIDALMRSGTIMARGFENLSKAMLAFTQTQVEQNVSAAKAMLGVKTLRELVDLQTEFARTSFDSLIAEATKVSEMSVKVTNEALEPLSARVNAAVEQMAKPKLAA
ncbi:phasin family protein [Rhodocista pekingensis]|uniref:Phasin family protein n=1 Tax=Rhodocista pekingensis TaxID=201185 RepID=A0ABW2KW39_9PROT